jgi:peptide deformylase
MAIREILMLGNPKLYEESSKVARDELDELKPVVEDLKDTLEEFREEYEWGRAIAAPQIGVMKRIVYMHVNQPVVFINPVIKLRSRRKVLVWDDCMSAPELLVKVKRYRRCKVEYRDMNWQKRSMYLEGKLAALLQHEVDHLKGLLIVQRAITDKSFALQSERALLR